MTDHRAAPMALAGEDASVSQDGAVARWLQLGGRAPAWIETLKPPTRKSAVYLLRGAGTPDVVAKRALASTLITEHSVYALLRALSVSGVRCFGIVPEPDTAYAWLFTEHVEGAPFSGGDATHRALAGCWLASVHTSGAALANDVSLPSRDLDHYMTIVRLAARTVQAAQANPAMNPDDVSALQRIDQHCAALERAWRQLADVAGVLPPTLVHGGFGSKNVRIRDQGGASEVLAFDWEAAGWGTPAADLAAVDPDAYYGVLARSWPAVSRQSITRLALLGRILASVSAIPGEKRALEGAWPHRVMAKMRVYERRLSDARRALGIGDED
jgi:aminoglycoside phosphotransferase (APT) family kinase protein